MHCLLSVPFSILHSQSIKSLYNFLSSPQLRIYLFAKWLIDAYHEEGLRNENKKSRRGRYFARRVKFQEWFSSLVTFNFTSKDSIFSTFFSIVWLFALCKHSSGFMTNLLEWFNPLPKDLLNKVPWVSSLLSITTTVAIFDDKFTEDFFKLQVLLMSFLWTIILARTKRTHEKAWMYAADYQKSLKNSKKMTLPKTTTYLLRR